MDFQRVLVRADAADVLRRGVLAPLLLPGEDDDDTKKRQPCQGEVAGLPMNTAVARRADRACARIAEVRAMLIAAGGSPATSDGSGSSLTHDAHTREAIRQVSCVCARLNPSSDSALPLFEALASLHHDGSADHDVLHPDFLRVVPVDRLSECARLMLGARYLSVWRRYVRGLCDSARSQAAFSSPSCWANAASSSSLSDAEGTRVASMIVPDGEGTDRRAAREQYVTCPSLHLVALHEMQSQYVAWGSPFCIFAMSAARERLEACLRGGGAGAVVSLGQGGQEEFILAPYLPSGALMASAWHVLSRRDREPGDIAEKAVQALEAILAGHAQRSKKRAQVRGAMWLHLQQYVKFQSYCHGMVTKRRAAPCEENDSCAMSAFLRFALCPTENQESVLPEEALLQHFRCGP